MGIYYGGQEYTGIYVGDVEISKVFVEETEYFSVSNPVSFFDSAVVGGWTDPNIQNATPGAVLLGTGLTFDVRSTLALLVSSVTPSRRISQRIPPSYVAGGVTAYIGIADVARIATAATRLQTTPRLTSGGSAAGPDFIPTAESASGIGIAIRDGSGNTCFFLLNDLNDTTEPYSRARYSPPGAASLVSGSGGSVLLVDTGHPNVDWLNRMFRAAS